MLISALAVFGVAAVIGLTLAYAILKKKETSMRAALLHGALGAAGLVLVLAHELKHPHPYLATAIVLLAVAALGGAWLFANDLRKKPGPAALIVIHALVAVVAVVLVLLVATQ
jgi:hypothetical protein